MTDQVMMELAKMQTKIRAYEHNEKKHIEQLHLRDEEISQLKKKIDLLELKENMIAKNKSYLELKAQKDVDQIKENQKLKEGKNDNQENSSSNRRKK
jgi:hypothetical protein